MYQLALPYFPQNEKLAIKISSLQDKLREKREQQHNHNKPTPQTLKPPPPEPIPMRPGKKTSDDPADDEYSDPPEEAASDKEYQEETSTSKSKPKIRKPSKPKFPVFRDDNDNDGDELGIPSAANHNTPRTKNLLRIINTRDISQIKLLKGVGAKKAEAIVDCLCSLEEGQGAADGEALITSLGQLSSLKGVGAKTVENMRVGLGA